MTSNYDALLAEAKTKSSILAKDYIPKLYRELVEVEKLEPHDAAERIKKDLVEIWSRDTIYTNLPDEAKQEGRGRPKKKDIEESVKPAETISIEQSSNGSTATVLEQGGGGGSDDDDNSDYDKLANEHNKTLVKLEGVQTENDYLHEQLSEIKQAIKLLQETRPNIQVAKQREEAPQRNPNRGYWIRFDLSNLEITRPLINIIMRARDRPKQFYVEVLGDEVVEVSETVLR